MRDTLLPFILIFLLPLFFSCASSGYGQQGYLYTSHHSPIQETRKESKREGKACLHSWLGLIAYGNADLPSLIKVGKLQEINSLEWESFAILGIYGKLCVIAKGN